MCIYLLVLTEVLSKPRRFLDFLDWFWIAPFCGQNKKPAANVEECLQCKILSVVTPNSNIS